MFRQFFKADRLLLASRLGLQLIGFRLLLQLDHLFEIAETLCRHKSRQTVLTHRCSGALVLLCLCRTHPSAKRIGLTYGGHKTSSSHHKGIAHIYQVIVVIEPGSNVSSNACAATSQQTGCCSPRFVNTNTKLASGFWKAT